MSTEPCCRRSPTYTVRRYDEQGNTLWIRDYFRDSNRLNNAFTDDGFPVTGEFPLCVAATADRIYVGGPLVSHYFAGRAQEEWNLVCYEAKSGARLNRRNVWQDAPYRPSIAITENVVDVCIGQNGQIGVLTYGDDWLNVQGDVTEGSGFSQTVFIYTAALQLVTTIALSLYDGSQYSRLEIDAAGALHLAGFQSADGFVDTQQRHCVWLVDHGELIGCTYPDALVLPNQLPLRKESGAPPAVAWSTLISDNIGEGQIVTEIATASGGDILASGQGFTRSGAHGVWGRFTSGGNPTYVGTLPHSSAITGGRISCSMGSGQYFLCTEHPSLLCRAENDNRHLWAHQHQFVSDLYAIPTGGVVSVGQRASVGVNETDFIPASAL